MTKPTMLIIGDSFMSRDPNFPGEHWSEMIDEYQVVNRAVPGNSPSLICLSLYENLHLNPDVVVIGFTDPYRIEFDSRKRTDTSWITSCHKQYMTDTEILAYDLWSTNCAEYIERVKCTMQLHGLFLLLDSIKIKYVYAPFCFAGFLENTRFENMVFFQHFEKYADKEIPFNLAMSDPSSWGIQAPVYHINSQEAQKKFAQSTLETIYKIS
jgi:hypothetical protein